MQFVEDLEQLESMFEEHKIDNHEIQEFRQSVDDCIAHQVCSSLAFSVLEFICFVFFSCRKSNVCGN